MVGVGGDEVVFWVLFLVNLFCFVVFRRLLFVVVFCGVLDVIGVGVCVG